MSNEQRTARVYLRVSTDGQDLARQEALVDQARAQGFYVAAVYREKASGTTTDRPELQRMIADLQPGDVVIAEKIDRLSRLPLEQAEALVEAIKAKGAKLAIPGVVDLSEIAAAADGVARVVLQGVQDMLLRLALQMARDDYETRRERQAQGIEQAKAKGVYKGRKPDADKHAAIRAHLAAGLNPSQIARLVGCSRSTVYAVTQEVEGNV
ncbi:recombinase family protein [Crenobacter intestini]|uniref:Resolvase n=1 Tax=Crenobacter intestini TaxID=2563443 RepID=A0A4T0UIQ3_9NEIS|nr:recombinase family protein [Crenobacter intestini]TIC78418.1 resolvase [Crenobacter intestini]